MVVRCECGPGDSVSARSAYLAELARDAVTADEYAEMIAQALAAEDGAE